MSQRLTSRTIELRRCVITGLGCVTPVGNDVASSWSNLLKGVSGVGHITGIDVADMPVQIAAQVKDFDPCVALDRKDARRYDPFLHYAAAASQEAVESSGVDFSRTDPERVGVLVGSGIGGLKQIEDNHATLIERGPRRVSPFFIPMMVANMASGAISIRYGARGPNSCVVTACAAGTHAIGDSLRLIQRGDADVMIAGGAEAPVLRLALSGFASMKALSRRNDDPQRASRPFDRGRDGFVVGEGAGIVVLESLEHALARGAGIHAEVVGYGQSSDAFHITAPSEDGEGAQLCMRRAIEDAQLEPDDVDYINAHGTSTPLNDKVESLAIRSLFGPRADGLAVSSTKSMTGHALGAAGGMEAVFTALAVRDGRLPPTINYEEPDPDCDLDYVPNEARTAPVRAAMSNSFGFGGTNASLMLVRYDPS